MVRMLPTVDEKLSGKSEQFNNTPTGRALHLYSTESFTSHMAPPASMEISRGLERSIPLQGVFAKVPCVQG